MLLHSKRMGDLIWTSYGSVLLQETFLYITPLSLPSLFLFVSSWSSKMMISPVCLCEVFLLLYSKARQTHLIGLKSTIYMI